MWDGKAMRRAAADLDRLREGFQRFLARDFYIAGSIPLTAPMASVLFLALLTNGIQFAGGTAMYFGDSGGYLISAYNLFDHGTFTTNATRTPGYHVFLAPILGLGGKYGISLMMAVQQALMVILALVVVKIGDELDPSRALGFVAGLICAFSLQLQSYARLPMTEGLYTFICTLGLLYTLRHLRTGTLKTFLLATAIFSLAALVRPVGMYLAVAFLCLPVARMLFPSWRFIFPGRKPAGNRREHAKGLILGAAIFTAAVLPWSFHNYNIHGFFGLVSNLGQNLYSVTIEYGFIDENSEALKDIQARWAQMQEARRKEGKPTETKYTWRNHWPAVHAYLATTGLKLWQADKVFMRAALDAIRANPWGYLRKIISNMYLGNFQWFEYTHRYVPGLKKGEAPPDFMRYAVPVMNLENNRGPIHRIVERMKRGSPNPILYSEPTFMTPVFGVLATAYHTVIRKPKVVFALFLFGLVLVVFKGFKEKPLIWWSLPAYVFYQAFLPLFVVMASPRQGFSAYPAMDIFYAMAVLFIVLMGFRILRAVASLNLRGSFQGKLK